MRSSLGYQLRVGAQSSDRRFLRRNAQSRWNTFQIRQQIGPAPATGQSGPVDWNAATEFTVGRVRPAWGRSPPRASGDFRPLHRQEPLNSSARAIGWVQR